MADSWEDIDKQQQSTKPAGLNPAASSFTFNPAVASWSPGGPAPAAAATGVLSLRYAQVLFPISVTVTEALDRSLHESPHLLTSRGCPALDWVFLG